MPSRKRKASVTSKNSDTRRKHGVGAGSENDLCLRQRQKSEETLKDNGREGTSRVGNFPTMAPHVAARCATLRQTRLLLQCHPEAARQRRDDDNILPLHVACCERHGHNESHRLEIVKTWYEAYPHAAVEPDNEGNTPFRKLLKRLLSNSEETEDELQSKASISSASSSRADLSVLQFLFEKTATIPDNDDKFARVPFHHYCQLISTLPWKSARGREGRPGQSAGTSHVHHAKNLWTNLMSLFRHMVQEYPHIALGYVDRRGYTPLMLLVKEVPQPFYDLQTKVEQHVRDWRRKRQMLLQRRRRLLRLRNGEEGIEDNVGRGINEDNMRNQNRNDDMAIEGDDLDDEEVDGGELAIMMQLANQISEDIASHQSKNLSYFANTLLLAIPMFRDLWHSREHELEAMVLGNAEAATAGNNHDNAEEAQVPEAFEAEHEEEAENTEGEEDDGSSSSEEEDMERPSHWKPGIKMPQQEAELLQMAYEGAINAIILAADREEEVSTGECSAVMHPSLGDTQSMKTAKIDIEGFKSARCYSDRRFLGAVVNTFQVRFLSLMATAFHPHDFLKLLDHCISRHHFRPDRLNETNETKFDQSVLHNFLTSLRWKAQVHFLQQGKESQLSGDAKKSCIAAKQLFSSIRVSANLDMEKKDGPTGFNFILDEHDSDDEESDDGRLPNHESRMRNEASSETEQKRTYLPENDHFARERSTLTAFEAFLTLAPTATQPCRASISLPLYVYLKGPTSKASSTTERRAGDQGNDATVNHTLDTEQSTSLVNRDSQFTFGHGDGLVACRTKEGYMVQRLAQEFPTSCYSPIRSCPYTKGQGILYPFMIPALQEAEKQNSSATGNSREALKGKKKVKGLASRSIAPASSLETDNLSTTYFLLKRFVAARDLSTLRATMMNKKRM